MQIAGPGAGQPNLDELGAPTDLVMTNGRSAIPPSEGNEVRRDGWQGVGARVSFVVPKGLTELDLLAASPDRSHIAIASGREVPTLRMQ